MSQQELVDKFTRESTGISVRKPRPYTKEEVKFLLIMLFSEAGELARTVTNSDEESLNLVKECVGHYTKHTYREPKDDIDIMADQMDAIVDMQYYMRNSCSKVGLNPDPIFCEVHEANERKKVNGKYILDERGKVIKPEGWIGPNVREEIEKQVSMNLLKR